ncbi:hypothetical protein A2U01_0020527, partial [Trifolium medium]|nr:hypothetical protein [Trifolium medium]
PPKVTNVKIIGDLRENGKVTATGIVTGGTEGSSRAFRIPLGAVGCYIVAKYTPMTPDGDSGESTFVISDRAVESSSSPKLEFLINYWRLQ